MAHCAHASHPVITSLFYAGYGAVDITIYTLQVLRSCFAGTARWTYCGPSEVTLFDHVFATSHHCLMVLQPDCSVFATSTYARLRTALGPENVQLLSPGSLFLKVSAPHLQRATACGELSVRGLADVQQFCHVKCCVGHTCERRDACCAGALFR